MDPTAGGVFSGSFMLKVKSAVFDCTASSETDTINEESVALTTVAPGICTLFPLTVAQTFSASSDEPFCRMNSLSLSARDAKSGVEATVWCAMSFADGAGVIVKSLGGFRLACAAVVTLS